MASAFEKKLLGLLKKIGNEKVAHEDEESGAVEVVTNLESLARVTWKEALGYFVKRTVLGKNGEPVEVKDYHAPDRYAKQILFDHLLGKPKPQAPPKDGSRTPKAPPLHDRVDSALTNHLNEYAEKSHANSNSGGRKDKTATGNSISKRLNALGMPKHRPKSSKEPD